MNPSLIDSLPLSTTQPVPVPSKRSIRFIAFHTHKYPPPPTHTHNTQTQRTTPSTRTHTQLHSHTGHTNAALLEVLLYFIKSLFEQSEIILDENSKHTQSHIRVTHILWYASFWSFYF